MKVPLLPVVRPAPVAAAAGESPTAAAPLPAVYGYTPEQRVGTERQGSGKLRSRRQTEGGGADRNREIHRNGKSQDSSVLPYKGKMTQSWQGGSGGKVPCFAR